MTGNFIDLAEATRLRREAPRVITIHDGAKAVGWIDATNDVASLIASLARRKRYSGEASDGYGTALNDVLQGIQDMRDARRPT